MSQRTTPKDDRNLIEVTPELPQLSDEEKLALMWQRVKTPTLVIVATGIILLAGNLTLSALRQSRTAALQSAYLEALDGNNLRSFGEENARSSLGGFALLQAADQAYAAGNFADAISLYEKAAEAVKSSPLEGRALLGLGFAQVSQGNTDGGRSIFQRIKSDAALFEVFRGEAAYALAVLALDAQDNAAFASELSFIRGLDQNANWLDRLQKIAPERL